ncbi:MAG: DUF805 domain-containing protein [Paracoccaceae bacterium]
MGPLQSIKTCLVKSFQFSGRATRPEFWWFTLATIVLMLFLLYGVDFLLLGYDSESAVLFVPFSDTFSLLTLPASLSVTARRFQDRSLPGLPPVLIMLATTAIAYFPRSGEVMGFQEWALIVTGVLNLIILVICAFPSTPSPNRHGPGPHGPNRFEVFQ